MQLRPSGGPHQRARHLARPAAGLQAAVGQITHFFRSGCMCLRSFGSDAGVRTSAGPFLFAADPDDRVERLKVACRRAPSDRFGGVLITLFSAIDLPELARWGHARPRFVESRCWRPESHRSTPRSAAAELSNSSGAPNTIHVGSSPPTTREMTREPPAMTPQTATHNADRRSPDSSNQAPDQTDA
jgi:hypothetical protein